MIRTGVHTLLRRRYINRGEAYLAVNRSFATDYQTRSIPRQHTSHGVDVVDLAFTEYVEHCPPSGTWTSPVVIAHGLLGSRTNWHSLSKVLNESTGRKIMTVDLRGHGESAHRPSLKYEDHRNDIERFLIARRMSKAVLVGHSTGGRIMMFTAIHKPGIVEKLVVIDVSPVFMPIPKGRGDPRILLDALINAEWDPNMSLSHVRQFLDGQLCGIVKDVVFRQVLLTNLVKSADGVVKWCCDLSAIRNFLDKDVTEEALGIYPGPTLFICGEQSVFVPKESQETIKEIFPKAEFVYIPGAAHLVPLEKPREFLEAIIPFLSNREPT